MSDVPDKVKEHRFGYITFFPGVKAAVLKQYLKERKIEKIFYEDLENYLFVKGYEVTVDKDGRLSYIRDPSNGHQHGLGNPTDLTSLNPEEFPARDVPFKVDDPTTWTTVEGWKKNGDVWMQKDGNKPGTYGWLKLSELTSEQIALALLYIREGMRYGVENWQKMLDLIIEGKYEDALLLMDDLDGEYFASGDESLNKENLKAYLERSIERSLLNDRESEDAIGNLEAEIKRRKIPKKEGYNRRDRKESVPEDSGGYIFRWIGGRVVYFKPKYKRRYVVTT